MYLGEKFQALEMDADNIKGLFRRGQANLALAEFAQAKADFRRVVELDPSNKAAQNQVTVCLHKMKQASDKEKRLYGNMFEKFAEQDRKVSSAGSLFLKKGCGKIASVTLCAPSFKKYGCNIF